MSDIKFENTACDAALIVSPENRFYYTGFESSDGFLIVTAHDAFFITDGRYIEAAQGKVKNCDEVELLEKASGQLPEIVKQENISVVYTEEEKLQILKRHLMPKQIREHGMRENALKMNEAAMKAMIEDYTREAGVRTLERTAASVCRKAAVKMLDSGKRSMNVGVKTLRELLGAPKYLREDPEKEPRIGVVNGLAWTSVGGELLEVECSLMPGKGSLKLTGQLGDVMKESAEAAFSWVRAHSKELKLEDDFYQKLDIHIHVPEGAVPKDGPSAGVTMATALVSALTGTPVRQNVAMTGEITLRGRVLPIGGLKEKTLAAYRAGIDTLIIPAENRKDLEKIPTYVLDKFRIVPVREIRTVLDMALKRD